jgi:hypothetical protein
VLQDERSEPGRLSGVSRGCRSGELGCALPGEGRLAVRLLVVVVDDGGRERLAEGVGDPDPEGRPAQTCQWVRGLHPFRQERRDVVDAAHVPQADGGVDHGALHPGLEPGTPADVTGLLSVVDCGGEVARVQERRQVGQHSDQRVGEVVLAGDGGGGFQQDHAGVVRAEP